MGTGTASADPAKLEAAAQAVPDEVEDALVTGCAGLWEKIATFNGRTQSPHRISVDAEFHAGAMGSAVATGDRLDALLVRVAAAFRTAGSEHPPGFIGPVAAGGTMFLGEAQLLDALARWNNPQPLAFQLRDDGTYEVRGPDGHWYVLRDGPPVGGVPLDRGQQVVDLGNPDYGLVLSAGIIIGLTGGSTQPLSRSAPPSAYQYIHLDENGYPIAGSGVAGQSQVPRPPVLGDDGSPPKSGLDAIGNIQGGLSEASKYMDERYRNVYLTQTTFYVDPRTNERVAVVDAASIRYDNDSNDAIVTSGRLATDERGRPALVPRPPMVDPDAPYCPPAGQPGVGPATQLRIPVGED